MSSSPPVISFSSIRPTSGDKDTVRNIRATKGFTVNIISEPWIQQANICCIDSSPDVSEWSMCGLRKEPSVSFEIFFLLLNLLTLLGSYLTFYAGFYRSMSKHHASRKAHFPWNARYIYLYICVNLKIVILLLIF